MMIGVQKKISNGCKKVVYNKAMVDCGITIRRDTEVMLKITGEITTNEHKAYGQKTKYVLTHAKMVLFAAEVGNNTSQKNDGNIGGQKFVVENNQ